MGVGVYARWAVLGRIGVRRDAPGTIRVENRPLWLVLWIILNEAACGSGERLAYEATTDVILISTHRGLSRRMIVQLYDVRNVIADVPDFRYTGRSEPQEGTVTRTIVEHPP